MRAGPVALEIVIEALGNVVDRKAGGVRGYDRARPAMRCELLQQAPLDGEVFGHGLDDPIGLGTPGEIVFEISGGDAISSRRGKKRGRPCLLCGFQASADDAVADARVREHQTAGFFLRGELGRHDVKQKAMDARVGQMSGDAGAHGSGAEYGGSIDLRAGSHRVARNSFKLSVRHPEPRLAQ